MNNLHLVSCNIEGERHLEPRVVPFLQAKTPDVVCLQEVFKCDLPVLQAACQATHAHFIPMAAVSDANPHMSARGELGLAIFVKAQAADGSELEDILFHHHFYFQPDGETVPVFFANENPNSMARVLLWVTFTWQGQQYCVATTHFTWSMAGAYTDEQARDLQNLLMVSQLLPPHILCGDFNSPRRVGENNAFAQLSRRYHDFIPAQYHTSIDGALHKAGALELMVDGLFAHPIYQLDNVELVPNVSDHMAVSGWMGRR
jgi:endonuclease/exonuclease/phosphatase family metal-dependent hydrolase